jgi:type IV pilus assembly protein PilC
MQYWYKALKNDTISTSTLDSSSEGDVALFLKRNGYLPIEIKKVDTLFPQLQAFMNRVNFTDVVDFTRQLAIMLNAGLTLIDCFAILEKQIRKPGLLALIQSINKDIMAGGTFSSSLQKYPDYFSNLYVSLVKSGEASGKLSDILLKLAENLEKQREFQSKIKSALAYPVIVIVGMLLVVFVMMTFVIPKLLNLYKDFNVTLPVTTQILITVSDFFQNFWPFIIAGTFGAVAIFKRYASSPQGRLTIDSISLKLPAFGPLVQISALVDSTRTLAILIGSGVSILDALDIIIDTTGNLVFKNSFKNIYKQVEKGYSLGTAMNNEGIFPPILVQMATVGEQTGKLDDTLLRISHYFEMESEIAVKTLTTLIEPAILIVLGVGVGFLVISVITPIYNLTNSFQ